MTPKSAIPSVVAETGDYLIVLKPPYLATTSPDSGPSLTRWAQSHVGPGYLHPTSRLDSLVSGLVVFAKTAECNAKILEARRSGSYRREYWALVTGQLVSDAEAGQWEAPIALDPQKHDRRIIAPGGLFARTLFEPVKSSPLASFVRLFPQTGRTHQLRLHCSHFGHPIWGDVTYKAPKRATLDDGRVFSASRVMLHCRSVRIEHPQLHIEAVSHPPTDFLNFYGELFGGEDLPDPASNAPVRAPTSRPQTPS